MKKLDLRDPETTSRDPIPENLERTRDLFPEAWTEGKIDFDVLKQLLGGSVDEREEKYGLNWHGKRQARQLALTPSTGTLRPRPDESVDWDTTQNLMIEGDNLEVLKLLQKSYAAKVKVIYIDPPYNRGKDLVYRDDRHDNIRNYQRLTGQVDESGSPLHSNRETSGRFHTAWLNMMCPRLMLGRQLLREDGIVLISIDDHEVHDLRLLCDSIFGEENFVAQLIWEKGRKNDAKLFSIGHDYILVYARSAARLSELDTRWREALPGAFEVQVEYLRLKTLFGKDFVAIEQGLQAFYTDLPRSHPSKRLSRYSHVDERGVWRDDNISWPGGGGPTYDVIHPRTGLPCAVPEGGWRYSTAVRMQQMIDAGRVMFRDDHSDPPIRKTYLVRLDDPDSDDDEVDEGEAAVHVAGTYFYRSALQASNLMLDLFGAKVFDSPKDHEVLARWIRYVTPTTNDDLIVDFFAGSGSTGHAVMDLNAADSGSRRFILVQLPEKLDPQVSEQKVAAEFCAKISKPATLAEITKERLRRAGTSLHEKGSKSIDVGFRVFQLTDSNINAWDPHEVDLAAALDKSVEHIRDGRTEEDIFFELLLRLGVDLTSPVEVSEIAGHTVRNAGGGRVIACLAPRISNDAVERLASGIADWSQSFGASLDGTIVFRDSAFANDVAKTNLTAILAQRGITNVRSI
jgi:adenine-specific DNA-methyltransferase